MNEVIILYPHHLNNSLYTSYFEGRIMFISTLVLGVAALLTTGVESTKCTPAASAPGNFGYVTYFMEIIWTFH
jgi:hypothetical protein